MVWPVLAMEQLKKKLEETKKAVTEESESFLSSAQSRFDEAKKTATQMGDDFLINAQSLAENTIKKSTGILQNLEDEMQPLVGEAKKSVGELSSVVGENLQEMSAKFEEQATNLVEDAKTVVFEQFSRLEETNSGGEEVQNESGRGQKEETPIPSYSVDVLFAGSNTGNEQPVNKTSQGMVDKLFKAAEILNDSKEGLRLRFNFNNKKLTIDEAVEKLTSDQGQYLSWVNKDNIKYNDDYKFLESLNNCLKQRANLDDFPKGLSGSNFEKSFTLIDFCETHYNLFLNPGIEESDSGSNFKPREEVLTAQSQSLPEIQKVEFTFVSQTLLGFFNKFIPNKDEKKNSNTSENSSWLSITSIFSSFSDSQKSSLISQKEVKGASSYLTSSTGSTNWFSSLFSFSSTKQATPSPVIGASEGLVNTPGNNNQS